MQIGPRITQRRIRLGLTQRDFAELVGVTAAAVSLWESGHVAPRKDRLVKIAEVLRCDVKMLIASMFDF